MARRPLLRLQDQGVAIFLGSQPFFCACVGDNPKKNGLQSMDLFVPMVPEEKLHPIFKLLVDPRNAPERAVVEEWARDFRDRDGKFIQEFQTTFESSFWELYLHAVFRRLGMSLDYSHHAPDFVVEAPVVFTAEATIAAPPIGGVPAHGPRAPQLPEDLNEFNRDAILRICNSFSGKVRRYRQYYSKLDHVQGKPFVIAIAPFDRPQAHLATNRPITAALYGVYYDEEATIARRLDQVVSYEIGAVSKSPSTDISVGLFCDGTYADVSAVIYGPMATWGKLRALADRPDGLLSFTTFHPNPGRIAPVIRNALKSEYQEDLLDGLYIFHNPFAARPLDGAAFRHERVAQIMPSSNGELQEEAPDDFLLLRFVLAVVSE